MAEAVRLPPGVTVFERGWLSANNVLFESEECTALVDSGYCTHAAQTVQMVKRALGGRQLDLLLNTHLHGDHCGGNAGLQECYPAMQTRIPPGLAAAVLDWDPVALTHAPIGQQCPPFRFEGLLRPGTEIVLAGSAWQIHAAPGHDPHSVVLFEPRSRTLISADALWENGFGVVFPELEGQQAFGEVAATLDIIHRLQVDVVIPGHGKVFCDVEAALSVARRRLESLSRDPPRHGTHAAKVLLKFRLLELQRIQARELVTWAKATPYIRQIHQSWFGDIPIEQWVLQLVKELVRSGALACEGQLIFNV
jgi:glyoxylase-like metal-dependent hydrolase (beta-lactamase superfamily II)